MLPFILSASLWQETPTPGQAPTPISIGQLAQSLADNHSRFNDIALEYEVRVRVHSLSDGPPQSLLDDLRYVPEEGGVSVWRVLWIANGVHRYWEVEKRNRSGNPSHSMNWFDGSSWYAMDLVSGNGSIGSASPELTQAMPDLHAFRYKSSRLADLLDGAAQPSICIDPRYIESPHARVEWNVDQGYPPTRLMLAVDVVAGVVSRFYRMVDDWLLTDFNVKEWITTEGGKLVPARYRTVTYAYGSHFHYSVQSHVTELEAQLVSHSEAPADFPSWSTLGFPAGAVVQNEYTGDYSIFGEDYDHALDAWQTSPFETLPAGTELLQSHNYTALYESPRNAYPLGAAQQDNRRTCGPVSLKMLLGALGRETGTIENLMAQCQTDEEGTPIPKLLAAAEGLGQPLIALNVDPSDPPAEAFIGVLLNNEQSAYHYCTIQPKTGDGGPYWLVRDFPWRVYKTTDLRKVKGWTGMALYPRTAGVMTVIERQRMKTFLAISGSILAAVFVAMLCLPRLRRLLSRSFLKAAAAAPVVALLGVFVSCRRAPVEAAAIEASVYFEPNAVDYGRADVGKALEKQVVLYNGSARPFKIWGIYSGCECVTADIAHPDTLAPGAGFELPVILQILKRGDIDGALRVTGVLDGDPATIELALPVRAVGVRGIVLEPSQLVLSRSDGERTGTVRVHNWVERSAIDEPLPLVVSCRDPAFTAELTGRERHLAYDSELRVTDAYRVSWIKPPESNSPIVVHFGTQPLIVRWE